MASTVPMPSSDTPAPPEVTILNRFASIPIVGYSLQQISSTLSSNAYTASSYTKAKDLSLTAYNYSAPIQVRFAPLIQSVDGLANKAVDVVQSKYPYPFEAQPEEVAEYVRSRRQSVVDFVDRQQQSANKTIEARVTSPALTAVSEIDQRFTPIVDYLESTAVNRLHTPATPADAQYHYQAERVYVLSKQVTGQLYDYSQHTVLAQRAMQTTDVIAALAASTSTRIHALSDSLLVQLQRLQGSLASTSASVQSSTATASHELTDAIHTLSSIVTTPDLTVQDKLARVGAEVQGRVRPVLDNVLRIVQRHSPAEPADPVVGNGHVE
ncbi:unnamed protein product [Mycena citricolor]|uniref:Lipid droplet-associated perilipin protein n=1 Tax=Mycena citricolor TaxID=2018698 RepID=A0AAD2K7C3_9AGAR|nr:unnamed protein product [Mycena citricolor]